jgi:hypothetical protein
MRDAFNRYMRRGDTIGSGTDCVKTRFNAKGENVDAEK